MARKTLCIIPVLLATACVETDGPSVFVGGNVVLEDDCTARADDPTLLLGPGVFNAEFGTSYVARPWFQNQLIDRATSAPSADPNWVLITGVEVELQAPGGAPIAFGGLPNPFTVETSTAVPSTEMPQEPGSQIGSVEIIPAAYAQALDAMLGDAPNAVMSVIASMTFFGETTGGVDVDVAPWTWQVTVCQGDCLLTCVSPSGGSASCSPCQNSSCPAICGTTSCDPALAGADCSAGEVCIEDTGTRAALCTRLCASDADCVGGGRCLLGNRCVFPL